MIIYDILLIIQYQVSTTVMDLVVVFALFVFMLALLCFCVAAVFTVNKDLYIIARAALSIWWAIRTSPCGGPTHERIVLTG